jgi:branched-subunit amino acid aminotransferase/4-amino-4-deoxychorismate lyase
MHEFVSFNRRIIPAAESFLSATSAAALYGKGIFTTVAIYNSKPFQWEKHWQRLTVNAQKTGIDLVDFSRQPIEDSLAEIVAANKLVKGRARLTFFDESSSRIWQREQTFKTSFLIQTADFQSHPKKFRLTISPFVINSKSPLAGIKSCNYLENILALEDAKANGFDEAIRLNERGEIASAAMANLFWVKGKEIFSPSLKTGCLAGTMRAFFMENFAVSEIEVNINSLTEADAVFLTSAGLGIVKAESIDGHNFPVVSSITDSMQNFFRNFSENS